MGQEVSYERRLAAAIPANARPTVDLGSERGRWALNFGPSSLIRAYSCDPGIAVPSNLAFLDERGAVLERRLASRP
jgi:hypothetical protein